MGAHPHRFSPAAMTTLHLLQRAVLYTLLALTAASLALPADAASKTPAKKSKSTKIKQQQNNSQESVAERDRRLYRECQGLPNAGACRGYTRR